MSVSNRSGRRRHASALRKVLGVLVLSAAALVFAPVAEAATLYTFSFVQTGYARGPLYTTDDTATLSGTFSGTLDGGGYLEAANLTDLHLSLHYDTLSQYDIQSFGAPYLFSYLPGDDGSLNIVQSMDGGTIGTNYACVGFAVSLVCDGTADWRGSQTISSSGYFFSYLVTTSAPVVTLVSAVSDDPSPVATTPIPATLPLFVSALGGLGAFGVRRRKQAVAA